MSKDFHFHNYDYFFMREQGEASIFRTCHNDLLPLGGAAAGYHPVNGSKIILAHDLIFDMLDENQFNAIMLHEEGHLAHNHTLAQTQEEININEMQADQYALDNGATKEDLNSALRLLIDLAASQSGLPKDFHYEINKARLDALKS